MNPLTHLPEAATLFLTRTIGANQLQSYYLARITNLLLALFLTSLAIKAAPVGKWLILSLGLLPMAIQQFSSLNYDAILIPLGWLFCALTYRIALNKKVNPFHLIDWVALAVLIILAKPAYFPMLFLGFFIAKRHIRGFALGLVVISIFFFLQMRIWGGVDTLGATKPGFESKISMSLKKPWVVPAIVLNTIASPKMDWEIFIQMLGKLGYADYYLDSWVYVAAVGMLALGILGSGDATKFSTQAKMATLLIVGSTIFSVFIFLYFLDTPLSKKVLTVRGVQGRYLLPVMYWLLSIFVRKKPILISRAVNFAWFLLVVGTAMAVVHRYY